MHISCQRSMVAALAALLLAACSGGGGDGPSGPAKVTTVSLVAPATQLEVGGTLALGFTAVDSKGAAVSGKTGTWSTSAPSVASIDANGVLTGVSAGQATVSVSVDGVSATGNFTVIPTPVAAVVISPRTPAVKPGETVTLSAITQDAIGRTLSGRAIAWSSLNPTIATVTNAGVVTGVASGSTYIVASSENKRDSVTMRVRSLNAPTVATSTPSLMTPGTNATVTGTNFSAVLTENEVLLNGTRMTVTAATPTTLQFTVPAASTMPCAATGPVPLAVVVNGDTATGSANLQVATARALGVGQHVLLTSTADLQCNEFSQTGGRYLVTAFNYSTSSATRTNFKLVGLAAGQVADPNVLSALPAAPVPTQGPLVSALRASNDTRFALGHLATLQANSALALKNPSLRADLVARRARARAGLFATVSPTARDVFAALAPSGAARTAPVPPPNVGDKLWKRMPKTFNNYGSFDSVRVRVVYVGPKLIIVEDTTNNLAGQMDADLQAVGAEFDQSMYGFLSNFGDPLAVDSLTDNNGRVIAMFTKRVNEYVLTNGGSLLGFVTLCDFFAQSDPDPNNVCLPSNEGEYFYAIAPNPNGTRGTYDLATWKRYTRGTMIHEMKHVVMMVQRIFLDASFLEETWLEEATAQMATEFWARKIYGSFGPLQDIGWAQGPRCDYASQSGTCPDPVEAILHPFQFLYTHYSASETKSIINNSDLVIYGSSWSFARWVTDAYGGANEAAFTQQLVQQQNDRGITNVTNRTGRPWSELLGLFSMASLSDNYPSGTITDPRLQLRSWNTRDVFSGMNQFLVFRNNDGSTTPAFPLQWPLRVRAPAFGTFPDVIQTVNNLPGGGWIGWDISGTQSAPQVLALRSATGGLPPAGIGMVVLRVQ